jgi:hypothetical protein
MDGGCGVPLKTGDLLSLLSGLGERRPMTQVVLALAASMSHTLSLGKSGECAEEPTTLMSERVGLSHTEGEMPGRWWGKWKAWSK